MWWKLLLPPPPPPPPRTGVTGEDFFAKIADDIGDVIIGDWWCSEALVWGCIEDREEEEEEDKEVLMEDEVVLMAMLLPPLVAVVLEVLLLMLLLLLLLLAMVVLNSSNSEGTGKEVEEEEEEEEVAKRSIGVEVTECSSELCKKRSIGGAEELPPDPIAAADCPLPDGTSSTDMGVEKRSILSGREGGDNKIKESGKKR